MKCPQLEHFQVPADSQIKANRQFRRFLLRGLDKVTIEFGLIALAHNLMKLWVKGLAETKPGDLYDSDDLILAL